MILKFTAKWTQSKIPKALLHIRTKQSTIKRSILFIFLGLLTVFFAACNRSIASPKQISAKIMDDKIIISWDAVQKADGYRLFRKLSSETEYKFICDCDQTSYEDSDYKFGETYSYKVCTVQSGSLSDGTESEPIGIQSAVKILSIKVLSQEEIEVTWEDACAGSYRLYGAKEGGEWSLVAECSGCEYLLQDAQEYTHLCISAVFITDDGSQIESPKSDSEIIPRGCTITSVTRLDKHTAAILFDSETDTRNYSIFRSSLPDGEYINIGQSFEKVFYDTGLESDTEMYYRIQPVTDTGVGLLSEPAPIGTNARQVTGIPVFMYHEFLTQDDLDSGVAFDEYAVWMEEFEQDLIWLHDNGYTTITTTQLAAWLQGSGTLPSKPVILTIDDGKYGVYKNAYPLLQKYNMTAVLSVIGERIEQTTEHPENRTMDAAPYCTWDEIGEMSRSGTIEITSHTYAKHRFNDNGHRGADIAENETEDAFFQGAKKDYQKMDTKLQEVTGAGTLTLSYPYSFRTAASDRVWMRCGYSILLAGDDSRVRSSFYNLYIQEAGINYYSALTRRMPRMTGTPISQYITEALSHDEW